MEAVAVAVAREARVGRRATNELTFVNVQWLIDAHHRQAMDVVEGIIRVDAKRVRDAR